MSPRLDDDTLFFFNYRSDRMREIVSVFGLDPKPAMDVTIDVPSNLVRDVRSLSC
jgi:2,3-bisphosphoglycerate-independent phosphoglycerate mutase